jgi:hypothetical protein
VFASIFPRKAPGEKLWVLVNRANASYTGVQIELRLEESVHAQLENQWRGAAGAGLSQLYDCWHGVPIVPRTGINVSVKSTQESAYIVGDNGTISVAFPVDKRGYGCILLTTNSTSTGTGTGTGGTPLGGFFLGQNERVQCGWRTVQFRPHVSLPAVFDGQDSSDDDYRARVLPVIILLVLAILVRIPLRPACRDGGYTWGCV